MYQSLVRLRLVAAFAAAVERKPVAPPAALSVVAPQRWAVAQELVRLSLVMDLAAVAVVQNEDFLQIEKAVGSAPADWTKLDLLGGPDPPGAVVFAAAAAAAAGS